MDSMGNKKYPDLKKIFVENKSDKEPESPEEEINKYIFKHPEIDHIKISVKNGSNLEELKLKIYDEINSPKKIITPMDKVKKRNITYGARYNHSLDENIKTISLILLGNSGVGKTNFMMRYIMNEFNPRFLSTQGIENIKILLEIKDENNNIIKYILKIYDTAGQERFRCLTQSYYKKADGVLLMFDVNDIDTFEDVNVWMTEIKKFNDDYNENKNENNLVIYLLGNKVDYLNNDEEEIGDTKKGNDKKPVTKKEKELLKNNLGFPYYEISNQWNLNIDEVIARIILDCAKRVNNKKDKGTKQIKKALKKKKKCCK